MPTEMHTICFHTRDAVERDDSRMVFEMPSHRLATPAVKVSLGSVEFPMVQWTIEEDWSRLWLSEGIRVERGASELLFAVDDEERRRRESTVALPLCLNPIVSVSAPRSDEAVFECETPHGLWAEDGSCLVARFEEWGRDVRVVACEGGDVSLVTAHADGCLRRVSETAFAVHGAAGRASPLLASPSCDGAALHTGAVPSPRHLCDLLTAAARGAEVGPLSFAYDATSDHVVVRARVAPGATARLLPSPLARAMGLAAASPVRAPVRDDGQTDVHSWVCLPPGPTSLWDYVSLPVGFYGPCHRSMCTGQPLRLGGEVESSVNRLYFPLPSAQDGRLAASPSTPHLIVFVDPFSRTTMCPIPCGKYTAPGLCAYLEAEMTRACSGDASFAVAYDAASERFSFACERRRDDGRVVAAPFSLLFNHPVSTDAARFGFPPQPCVGAATYVSPERVHFPRSDAAGAGSATGGAALRTLSNLVRVGEVAGQTRFRFHATTTPTLTALVCERRGRRCVVRTHVNGLPYAHGYQAGDVVHLVAPTGDATLMEKGGDDEADGEWREETYPAASGVGYDESAVVLSSFSCDSAPHGPTALVLAMAAEADVGTCVQLTTPGPEPFNLCFSASRPKSVDPYMLGFPSRSVLWGVDGSVDTGASRLPPFDAPHTHSLDHPDYVLITLNESAGASLEHHYGGESKHVFCKLSLYPLFREERMLPRDAFLQRSTFSRFEIAFWNPDMRRPYKFHGAEFSFSLNFLSVVPDAH